MFIISILVISDLMPFRVSFIFYFVLFCNSINYQLNGRSVLFFVLEIVKVCFTRNYHC